MSGVGDPGLDDDGDGDGGGDCDPIEPARSD